ncbi:MAG: hypothetical protein NPMRTH4_140002 [Nitrosopumilales archaeon]|nr:MAG: hypothetical protein NPMRTH4_140002 [Nitrosopumilales archaeon]
MTISIAIPDSSLSDNLTKLDKSRKISDIARACSIFKVDTIYVYNESNNKEDNHLIITILKYLETPPFLRKKLFPKINELKFAGALHPIKIASHVKTPDSKKIKTNDFRDGVVIGSKGKKFIDLGIKQMIPYHGETKIGKRITIQFKKGYPELIIKQVSIDQIPEYWGYKVKERGNLFTFISSWSGKIILTSRKGKIITKSQIKKYLDSKESILLVFGSPSKGIHEILGNKIKQVQNSTFLNFFPVQATETIRLEEAIFGSLAILSFEYNNYY